MALPKLNHLPNRTDVRYQFSSFSSRKNLLAQCMFFTVVTSAVWASFASVSHLRAAEVQHRFLTADSSKQRIAIIGEDGKTQWESKIGPLHDLHYLPSGNVLFQRNWTTIVEVDPKTNETVWSYDAAKRNGNEGKRLEIHAFQRLADGNTMIAESGVSRIIEVDPSGEVVAEIKLQVSEPHPHRDTRLARKLPSGNYLVCHEGDGAVSEYDPSGNVVWRYEVPLFGKKPANGHGLEAWGNQCFSAVRLKSGNTLISTGNGHGIIEVTPEHEIVWQVAQDDLEGVQLAWVTTLQVLPSGNIVIGNCHATAANPQIVEINREKQVVWTFKDFDRFGNATTNTQVLTTSGVPVIAEAGVDR